eukprot:CAMPEP_0198142898 /NCGR_PEP_ID=MMETSP1443-20131203/5577_1 /TAXON_ID=186043 /ORGANISM="Entomoneis sp., Strain CCMP2396" /LENGTH=90 /DNA_ID=CAMNT_0043806019 /DNA_START=85 /DNA_END=357 /DNA_ORIENTATION=-
MATAESYLCRRSLCHRASEYARVATKLTASPTPMTIHPVFSSLYPLTVSTCIQIKREKRASPGTKTRTVLKCECDFNLRSTKSRVRPDFG